MSIESSSARSRRPAVAELVGALASGQSRIPACSASRPERRATRST